MKTIKQLEEQKLEIEKQIKELEDKEQSQDFIEIKNFRVYKWSNPIKDFSMPKGYRMAEFQEFVDAYDNDIIKLEVYPVVYFVKHYSKKQQKKKDCLSGLGLDGDLGLVSDDVGLAYSDDYGRVVVVKEKLT